jgi:diguanylate cyclase (GGDEF)-like protein
LRSTKAERSALDGAVLAEQIGLLFRERFDLAGNLVVSALAAVVLSRIYPAWLTIAWLATLWVVVLARAAHGLFLRDRATTPENAAHRGIIYITGAFITASLWGLTGSVVLVTPDPLYRLAFLFVIAGMMTGGIVTNAAYLRAMFAFLVPIIFPVIVLLLASRDGIEIGMGAMLSIFAAVVSRSGIKINRTIVEGLRLRILQELLVIELRASEASMAEAQRLAHVGGLEIDAARHTILCTAEIYQIIGEDPATFEPTLDNLLSHVHADDRAEVRQTLLDFSHSGISRGIHYRIVMADGSIKYMRSNGRKVDGKEGRPPRLFASVQDITAETESSTELAYRDRLMNAVTIGTAILLQAQSIELGMPEALRILGGSMNLDRIDVIQEAPARAATIAMRFEWQSPEPPRASDTAGAPPRVADLNATSKVRDQLAEGKILVGQRAEGGGLLQSMLERLNCESMLLVPIVVDDNLWGGLGVATFRARAWSATETNTLKTFASVVGSLIVRNEAQLSLENSEKRLRTSSAELQFANMLLKTEMEASPDGIVVVDGNRKIISRNERFAALWGLQSGSLSSVHDAQAVQTLALSLRDPHKFSERVEYLYAHPDESGDDELEFNDGRFIDRRTATLRSPAGEYLGRVWYFRDITARKIAESLAIRTANSDVLTGLANRRVFVDELERSIAEAKRGKGGFAVLYLDLDHFKDVNDVLGHPVGDDLLEAVAGRLNSNMRAGDTVARFGGDEFAVLVSDVSDPGIAAVVADKLIKALAEPFSIGGYDIRSGASIGIDIYGPGSAQAEALLSHADVALYRAKAEGRNSYRFFTDVMDREVRTRVALGAELRTAVGTDELFLLYQPQVASDTGRITGLEALVRWNHPKHGILGPEIFIPVAESTGIIVALGHWALSSACRQAKAWFDTGIDPVRVSVNVSGLQFKMALELEKSIVSALAESELPAQLLEIELTETVLMEVSLEHSQALARLRQAGVTIAIDDFGTGYSSLAYLRRFPVDRIKIPREFVNNITTVAEQAVIVKATIGLAHELGIALLAEGVETREQLDALNLWGCREVQGFYFAPPLTAQEVSVALQNGGFLTPQKLAVV